MRRLDLLTRKPAEYKFLANFYVSGLGNVYTYVDINKNDEEDAIWVAKQKLGLKHCQQSEAFLISSPSKT